MRLIPQALLCCSLLAGCARHAPPLAAPATATTTTTTTTTTMTATPAPSPNAPVLSSRDLNHLKVVGELGIPLGTAADVRAVVTTGRSKGYVDRYCLRVTQVDARDLPEPVELDFVLAPGSGVELARDPFSLYQLKTGQETGSLKAGQREELEKGYVGKTVHLIVYEVGEFTGIPNAGLEGYGDWQGRAFHFETSLEVLAEAPKGEAR